MESRSDLSVLIRKTEKKVIPFKAKYFGYDKRLFYLSIPFIILIFMFSYLPIHGWIYAFFDYKIGIPLSQTKFAGLKFFSMLIDTKPARENLLRVLSNTFAMSGLGLLSTPLPVIFAIFLTEFRSRKYKKIVQTTTTLPNFISFVLIYTVFFSMFSVDDGLINRLGGSLFHDWKPYNPLGDGGIVWFFQTGVSIWKSLGWNAIIYLAAISSIDPELYDAAKVDGAGRFRSIRHITIPGIIPTYFVLLILGISGMVNNGLEQYLVFQNPSTKSALEVLDLYVYNQGIANVFYPYATAISILKTLVSLLLFTLANGASRAIRGFSLF